LALAGIIYIKNNHIFFKMVPEVNIGMESQKIVAKLRDEEFTV
jgi:hypothetical protein